jgi:hypothetical protein
MGHVFSKELSRHTESDNSLNTKIVDNIDMSDPALELLLEEFGERFLEALRMMDLSVKTLKVPDETIEVYRNMHQDPKLLHQLRLALANPPIEQYAVPEPVTNAIIQSVQRQPNTGMVRLLEDYNQQLDDQQLLIDELIAFATENESQEPSEKSIDLLCSTIFEAALPQPPLGIMRTQEHYHLFYGLLNVIRHVANNVNAPELFEIYDRYHKLFVDMTNALDIGSYNQEDGDNESPENSDMPEWTDLADETFALDPKFIPNFVSLQHLPIPSIIHQLYMTSLGSVEGTITDIDVPLSTMGVITLLQRQVGKNNPNLRRFRQRPSYYLEIVKQQESYEEYKRTFAALFNHVSLFQQLQLLDRNNPIILDPYYFPYTKTIIRNGKEHILHLMPDMNDFGEFFNVILYQMIVFIQNYHRHPGFVDKKHDVS